MTKNWVEQENIDSTTIRKERFTDGEWQRLPTEQTDEDEQFLYFVAENTGFSIFSINGDELTDEDLVPEPDEEPVDDPVDDEEMPGFTSLLAMIVISVVALVGLKYKNK